MLNSPVVLATRSRFHTFNGLNIYVKGDDKEQTLKGLYQNFFDLLVPGGLLLTSFLTFRLSDSSEWNMTAINQNDLLEQKRIFSTLLQIAWANFTTSTQIHAQLESVGFVDIKLIWDDAKMFPTVLAYKPA